jgi:serine-type D-Ala-D-Ala carboxypeptidase (penicillin-binding protein 5/6)
VTRRAAWAVVAAALFWLAGPPSPGAPAMPTPFDAYPRAAAAYIVVVDGRITWARNPDEPRPPASLAKLLTALVLLDDPRWDEATPIDVGTAAATVEGSRLGLRRGESLRAGEALTALLVRSANDACVALAEHFAGSIAAFVARMNARAAALGMAGSRFGHPCGLDAPGQRSTARDLLLVAGTALERPAIAARVALARAEITTLGGRRLAFVNGNALVGRVAGVIGMKSGFTRRAGKNVIAVAIRGGHHVWLVMLGAEERWWTAAGMIDAAFDPFRPVAP